MKLLLENWRKYLNEISSINSDAKSKEQEAVESYGYELGKQLGKGMYGVVYSVEKISGDNSGKRAALKVVPRSRRNSLREKENYEFVMNTKSNIPPQYAKYLPDVYEIKQDRSNYYIFMELMEPVNQRVRNDLFLQGSEEDRSYARKSTIKQERIFKDPEALYSILEQATKSDGVLSTMTYQIPRMLTYDQLEEIEKDVPSATLKLFYSKSKNDFESLSLSYMTALEQKFKEMKVSLDDYYLRALRDDKEHTIRFYLNKQIVPVHQGTSPAISTGGSSSEITAAFPEAAGFIEAIDYFMQDLQWQAKDIHGGNVMARPGTKDIVVVDLGLFKL